MYEGSTPLHFFVKWQGLMQDKYTESKFRGTYLHAAVLEPEIFEATYYVKPEITLDQLNEFRSINYPKSKPVNTVSAKASGYKELMTLLCGEKNPDHIAISQDEMNKVLTLRENIKITPDVMEMLWSDTNVYEFKQSGNIEGVEFHFICDIYNKNKSFEADIKTLFDDFVSNDKCSKLLGQEILQRACYNLALDSLGVKINDHYIIAVDGFMIPKLLRYDYSEIEIAMEYVSNAVRKFKQLRDNGIFDGYTHSRNEDTGKLIATPIPVWKFNQLSNSEGNIPDDETIDFIDNIQDILKNDI